MNKKEIIKTLVKNFEERLMISSDAIIYSIYAEYLTQMEKERQEKEGVKTNEV